MTAISPWCPLPGFDDSFGLLSRNPSDYLSVEFIASLYGSVPKTVGARRFDRFVDIIVIKVIGLLYAFFGMDPP